jgi:hypothetical protein
LPAPRKGPTGLEPADAGESLAGGQSHL